MTTTGAKSIKKRAYAEGAPFSPNRPVEADLEATLALSRRLAARVTQEKR